MLSLAFWSNYFRTNRIEIASLIIYSCSAIDFNSFPFFQNQLPLILLNRILDKQFPRVALYVRLSFLVIPRIAPLAYWSQCGRLIQLKQGQNKRLHCLVRLPKFRFLQLYLSFLPISQPLYCCSTYKTLPSKA
jgi:hypothetical protein